jgi:Creatinase/Prolidase N-terminal domain
MIIELSKVALPDFGTPTQQPLLSTKIHELRIEKLRKLMASNKMDVVVIYGDREHSANITYLCGYDPRFEESILIIGKKGLPALLVGNEGWGYCELAPLPVKRILFQSLSLLGQDRSKSKSLEVIFKEEGITKDSRIGVAGWKYFSNEEFSDPNNQFEVPSYIIDTLRRITGVYNNVINVNSYFMNPEDGLRIINEAEQLAQFEFASCFTSTALKNVLFGMKPGMTELEAATLMNANGMPLGAHTMLSSGFRATYGLPSPSSNKLCVGDRFTMAYSLMGALNARAGWLVHDETELPKGVSDYLQKLAIPYFQAIVKWYEHIGIGIAGGELYDIIQKEIGDPFFGVGLNPGHYIHLDEWVHSPIFKDSTIKLRSGMALQVDVIPATGSDYHTINIEDGIILADELLRKELQQKFPEAWKRIEARKKFMKDIIGINLKPEVLPLSNIPAYLPPYMLSPECVLIVKE